MPTTPTGRIRYDPRAETVKYRPGWAVLSVGWGWFHLYDHWLQRGIPGAWRNVVDEDRIFDGQNVDRAPRLGLVRQRLQPPAWGPHITLVRGNRPLKNQQDWGNFWQGRDVGFDYDPTPVTNGHHWWLWIDCPAMIEFRQHFGLSPKHPGIRPHLTFAVIPSGGGAIPVPDEYCL